MAECLGNLFYGFRGYDDRVAIRVYCRQHPLHTVSVSSKMEKRVGAVVGNLRISLNRLLEMPVVQAEQTKDLVRREAQGAF